jgi:hypothetical protein
MRWWRVSEKTQPVPVFFFFLVRKTSIFWTSFGSFSADSETRMISPSPILQIKCPIWKSALSQKKGTKYVGTTIYFFNFTFLLLWVI